MSIGSERQTSITVRNTTTAVDRMDLVWWEVGVDTRIVGVAWQTAAVTEDFNLCFFCDKIRLPIFGATGANFVEGSWVYYDATVGGRLVDNADGGANPRCAVVLEPVADGATTALVKLHGDIDNPLREAATDRDLVRTEFIAADVVVTTAFGDADDVVRTEFAAADDEILDGTAARPIVGTVYEISDTFLVADLDAAGPPTGQVLLAGVAGDTLQVVGYRILVTGDISSGNGDLAIEDASGTNQVVLAANAALTDVAIIGSHGAAIANVTVDALSTNLVADEGIYVRSTVPVTAGTSVTVSVLYKVAARA